MQIYTRFGDKGYTSVIGGEKLAKDSPRVTSYGELDELNSFVGLVISLLKDPELIEELHEIQKLIFDCGSDLADPTAQLKRITDKNIKWLEERIDVYAEIPDEIDSFILPGGTLVSSYLHVCRTIARRAERAIVALQWSNTVNSEDVKFVNRLSDYFYSVARAVNKQEGNGDVLYDRGGKVFHNEITKKDIFD